MGDCWILVSVSEFNLLSLFCLKHMKYAFFTKQKIATVTDEDVWVKEVFALFCV